MVYKVTWYRCWLWGGCLYIVEVCICYGVYKDCYRMSCCSNMQYGGTTRPRRPGDPATAKSRMDPAGDPCTAFIQPSSHARCLGSGGPSDPASAACVQCLEVDAENNHFGYHVIQIVIFLGTQFFIFFLICHHCSVIGFVSIVVLLTSYNCFFLSILY